MNRQLSFLIQLTMSILALAVCVSVSPAQATPEVPGTAALIIAESSTGPEGWTGPATLWLDSAGRNAHSVGADSIGLQNRT